MIPLMNTPLIPTMLRGTGIHFKYPPIFSIGGIIYVLIGARDMSQEFKIMQNSLEIHLWGHN